MSQPRNSGESMLPSDDGLVMRLVVDRRMVA
jgi:hypothetical protein